MARKYSAEERIVLEYLFYGGYADTLKSAEYIMENMSDEWFYEVLDEGSIADMLIQHNDDLEAKRKEREAAIRQRFDNINKILASHGHAPVSEPSSKKPSSTSRETPKEQIKKIKGTLNRAAQVIKSAENL